MYIHHDHVLNLRGGQADHRKKVIMHSFTPLSLEITNRAMSTHSLVKIHIFTLIKRYTNIQNTRTFKKQYRTFCEVYVLVLISMFVSVIND